MRFVRFFVLGVLIILAQARCWAEAPADQPTASVNDLVVWTINEYVLGQEDVDLAARVPSQLLVRGWFRWKEARDYLKDAPLVARVHANGQLFGGGVTMSALYRGENGTDEATFLDLATRDPQGRLYPAFGKGNYYHGTLSNPRFVDYCLKWVFRQIDAGVDHLFMDEVNAAHGPQEGYDDHAIREFRAWLLARPEKWGASDPQWGTRWGVPLGDKKVCPDGAMTSFDYRAYLQHHRLTEQPWGNRNLLAGLWRQFKAERDDRVWKEVCDRIRDYARSKNRRVWIAANGLNRHVDHQIQNLWEQHLFLDKNKRVDAGRSVLDWGRSLVFQSRTLLGRDVPIVVFHDWGFGMPWQEISPEDRTLWLRTFSPELYASGAFFAFPVHGPFGCDSRKDGTLETIVRQAEFFRARADCYRIGNRIALEDVAIRMDAGNVAFAVDEQPRLKRRLIHLINHNFADHQIRSVKDFEVSAPSLERPEKVVLASPDLAGEQSLPFTHRDGEVRVRVPSLQYYSLLVLSYSQMTPTASGRSDRDVVIAPRPFWEMPPVVRFEISPAGLVSDVTWVNAFVQGNLHSDLRTSQTFHIRFAQDGLFRVVVNSVAMGGAQLEIHLDGNLALRERLPDKDRRNDPLVGEINRTFVVPVPRGDHEIRVANTGGDWLTVDRYVFRNALGE